MGTKKEQPPTLVGIVQSGDYCFGDAPEDALQLDCGRSLRGVNIRISPLSFCQVNSAQTERLYDIAEEFAELTPETRLLDLYCGAGLIGLSMASKVKELIGGEIIPDAVEDAKANAAASGITNAEFLCGDAPVAAEKLRCAGREPDVVILDPPRAGCAPRNSWRTMRSAW